MSYPEVPPTTTIFLPMSLSADLTILKVVIQTPEQGIAGSKKPLLN
jgi:hypothetical protein